MQFVVMFGHAVVIKRNCDKTASEPICAFFESDVKVNDAVIYDIQQSLLFQKNYGDTMTAMAWLGVDLIPGKPASSLPRCRARPR